MKKLFFIFCLYLTLSACEDFDRYTYTPSEDLNTEFTNPNDPNSDGYPDPLAVITAGPSGGSVITNTNDVTFTWQGVHSNSLFKYKLENLETSWQGPSTIKSITYNDLSNGQYTFNVLEETTSGVVQASPTVVSFTINYVQSGVNMLFSNDNIDISYASNPEFSLDVMLNNIEDLMGARIIIKYNPNYLSVNSVLKGDLFGSGSNNVFLYNDDSNNGILEIETSVLNQPQGVYGSGKMATLGFIAKQSGNTSILFNQAETIIRDINNSNITIETFGSSNVNINQ